MRQGYLSQYFEGVAMKTLTAVEIDPGASHQHEFQGVQGLRNILGTDRITNRSTKFLYLSDDEEKVLTNDGFMTWYDARENQPTRSPEYHLYYSSPNAAVGQAGIGDTLLVAKRPDETLLSILLEGNSTVEHQVLWLFGFGSAPSTKFAVRDDLSQENDRIDYTSRFILESIGIEVEEAGDSYLDEMVGLWRGLFPMTSVFSAFARSTVLDQEPRDDPDAALMAWMEREEVLFRRLERYQLSDRLVAGFSDVDDFIAFSLSVQNRRKSRAGHALENHLATIFETLSIRFGRNSGAVTENKKKPDFLFPGKTEYDDPNFDTLLLTMLGSKSTCKDRWRQVVTEADKIKEKHLLTLEGAISVNQTDEMKSHQLQLVVPRSIQQTYLENQQAWLLDLSDFTKLVIERQGKMGSK
jgi:hypothetical protein